MRTALAARWNQEEVAVAMTGVVLKTTSGTRQVKRSNGLPKRIRPTSEVFWRGNTFGIPVESPRSHFAGFDGSCSAPKAAVSALRGFTTVKTPELGPVRLSVRLVERMLHDPAEPDAIVRDRPSPRNRPVRLVRCTRTVPWFDVWIGHEVHAAR